MDARQLPLGLLLFSVIALFTCACSVSGPGSAYPVPDILRMAEPQRHEFIQLFLQGRWCEARNLFERSVETYLLQDDFCAAAQNHLLIWKLKGYVGISDDHSLEQTQALLQTGRDCPEIILPAAHTNGDGPDSLPEKDRAYRDLLHKGHFEILAARLRTERDQLYASVYGRKAAQAAIQSGDEEQAEMIIQQTRVLDAKQGWIIFLIQDWKILHQLSQDKDLKTEIQQRIQRLQSLIQPCPL